MFFRVSSWLTFLEINSRAKRLRLYLIRRLCFHYFMRSEFAFLESLRKKFALEKIGDDCAVLPMSAKTDLVITSDLLVEDIDFRVDWTRAEFLGHKALAVSLSDIAAMGAKPLWAMLSIGIPEKIWKTDFIDKFYDGWFSLAKKFGVELVGGDVSKTPDKIVIDSIAGGEVKKGKAILRSGAKPGDLIYVTGCLGGASAGLNLLENGEKFETATGWRRKLISRQLSPIPSLKTVEFEKFPGSYVAEEDLESVTSMIDISDGVSSDLMHICKASSVGAKIYAEKIPIQKELRGLTKNFEEQLEFALHGGEDFELLYTTPPKKNPAGENVESRAIGEVTANVEIIELNITGESRILEPKGFGHF